MSVFEIFGDLLRFVGELFPIWKHVRKDYFGILYKKGNYKLLEPGINWWWPADSEIVLVPNYKQAIDLPRQTLVTKDDRSVSVSGSAVFQIIDPVAFLLNYGGEPDALQIHLMTSLRREVHRKDYKDILTNRTNLDQILTAAGQKNVPGDMGITIHLMRLTDFVPSCAISLLHSGEGGSMQEEDD